MSSVKKCDRCGRTEVQMATPTGPLEAFVIAPLPGGLQIQVVAAATPTDRRPASPLPDICVRCRDEVAKYLRALPSPLPRGSASDDLVVVR